MYLIEIEFDLRLRLKWIANVSKNPHKQKKPAIKADFCFHYKETFGGLYIKTEFLNEI